MEGGSDLRDMTKMVVHKLNTKKFYIWSSKIGILIRGRELWGFVGGTEDNEEGRGKIQKRDQAM